jgi:hypothetical protein
MGIVTKGFDPIADTAVQFAVRRIRLASIRLRRILIVTIFESKSDTSLIIALPAPANHIIYYKIQYLLIQSDQAVKNLKRVW